MLSTLDVLTELDVLDFDAEVLSTFGSSPAVVSANLAGKRRVAVEDWLYAALKKHGYSPQRHSVRWAAEKAFTLGVNTSADVTSLLNDLATDDLNLSTIFSTPASDYLYVGMAEQPRGFWLTMVDSVNINTLTVLTADYWTGGGWSAFSSFVDGTTRTTSIAFSGGGRLSWRQPDDWVLRQISTDSRWRYWLRLSVNQQPSDGAALSQVMAIRRSRLTTPAALYTLSLLYDESWGVQQGEWKDKAERYSALATDALAGAILDLDEFEPEPGVPIDPVNTPAPAPDPRLTTWERG